MNSKQTTIIVIGIDASGIESIPLSKLNLILSANRVAGPSRILNSFYSFKEKQKIRNLSQEVFRTDNIKNLIKWIKEESIEEEKTVILASGDPLWFGIGRILIEHFPKKNIVFHPAPTSFQIAFSRLGRPWQDAKFISLHGRDPTPLAKLLRKRPPSIAILTDPKRGGAKEVQSFIRAEGVEELYNFWIFEQLGHENEKIQQIDTKDEIPEGLNPLNLVILIEKKKTSLNKKELPLFGIDDGAFMQLPDRPGLMTKSEARIQLLAELELPEKGVLWDIGAGVGSIGLEALRIRNHLKLMLIDKRLGSKLIIKENASRLSVKPEYIFETDALEILKSNNLGTEINSPNRVILGGGGRQRSKLLKIILERLSPKGIVVVPLTTVQAINELEKIFESYNCLLKISQHQSYRGVSISNGIRLNPMNPIFILKGQLK